MSGIPVTISNTGVPVTPAAQGIPVTLVGGSAAAVSDGDMIDGVSVDGTSKSVTFTVAGGAITAITTA